MTGNRTSLDATPGNAASNGEPRQSGSERDFLDGRIGADQYIANARRIAGVLARREVDSDASKGRDSFRKIAEVFIFAAAGGYIILGGLNLGWRNPTIGTTALATGTAFALVGLRLLSWFHRKD